MGVEYYYSDTHKYIKIVIFDFYIIAITIVSNKLVVFNLFANGYYNPPFSIISYDDLYEIITFLKIKYYYLLRITLNNKKAIYLLGGLFGIGYSTASKRWFIYSNNKIISNFLKEIVYVVRR